MEQNTVKLTDAERKCYALVSTWATEHDTTLEEMARCRIAWRIWSVVFWLGVVSIFIGILGMFGFMDDVAKKGDVAWRAFFLTGSFLGLIAAIFLVITDRRFVAFNEDFRTLRNTTQPYLASPLTVPTQREIAEVLLEIIREKEGLIEDHADNLSGPHAKYFQDAQHAAALEARKSEVAEAKRLLRIFCGVQA